MQEQWKDAYPGVTWHLLSFAMKAISRDPEQGAYRTLWALTASEIDEKHQNGAYVRILKSLGAESAQAFNEKLGAQLWDLSGTFVREKVSDDALASWEASGAD